MERKMKTVEQLIEELKKYPQKSFVAAYSKEDTGIVVYSSNFYNEDYDDGLKFYFDEDEDEDDNEDEDDEDDEDEKENSNEPGFIQLPYIGQD